MSLVAVKKYVANGIVPKLVCEPWDKYFCPIRKNEAEVEMARINEVSENIRRTP